MARLHIPVGPSDHAQGPADAPLTVVEYGDYQCPYCGEAYPVLKAVQRAMGDRMRFVFRNFPLTEMHPNALGAAELAEAAAVHGKFWEAHDMLYEHQNAQRDRDLEAYGRRLGLDAQTIEAALNGANDARIQDDFSGGVRSGVNGTPCLFINGVRYDGPVEADTLISVLNQVADGATLA